MFEIIKNSLELLLFVLPFFTIVIYPVFLILIFLKTTNHRLLTKFKYTIIFALVINILFIVTLCLGFANDINGSAEITRFITLLNVLCILPLPAHLIINKMIKFFG